MLKQMLLGLGAASLLVVVTAMPVQAAPILPPGLQELIVLGTKPDTGSKWEWVWVSTCPEGRDNCSFKEGVDYGFTPPNNTHWNESFDNTGALFDAFTDPVPGGFFTGKCAYDIFSQDLLGEPCGTGDLQKGIVWQSPYPGVVTGLDYNSKFVLDNSEILWVRANADYVAAPLPTPMPEPSSLLLLGAGLLGLAAWRWKYTV